MSFSIVYDDTKYSRVSLFKPLYLIFRLRDRHFSNKNDQILVSKIIDVQAAGFRLFLFKLTIFVYRTKHHHSFFFYRDTDNFLLVTKVTSHWSLKKTASDFFWLPEENDFFLLKSSVKWQWWQKKMLWTQIIY